MSVSLRFCSAILSRVALCYLTSDRSLRLTEDVRRSLYLSPRQGHTRTMSDNGRVFQGGPSTKDALTEFAKPIAWVV